MTQTVSAQAVIYLRTATKEQQPGYSNLEVQRRECEAMARKLGAAVGDTYIDVGVSGLRAERPGLTRLLRDLSRGGIRYVLAANPARIARSQQLAQSLEDQITRRGATLIDDCENHISN